MKVYLKGKPIALRPDKIIGQGGEAEVYDIGRGRALKLFKPPDHPDFEHSGPDREAAARRIKEHQQKLLKLPGNLPANAIAPLEMVTGRTGKKIQGYVMRLLNDPIPLLSFADGKFRAGGVSGEMVSGIFRKLHEAVAAVHGQNCVIGDFNDLNVLIKDQEPYLIDIDSWQFGPFLCRMFTPKFLDPLLSAKNTLALASPYNPESDWYAFAVMLMQCLLLVGPYGGIYKPKDRGRRIPHDKRPLSRITVFHPEVKYPKPARRPEILPDELLHYFSLVFERDRREAFPADLINGLDWHECGQCGCEHARPLCPVCSHTAPAAIKEKITVHGKVTAGRIFSTKGVILEANSSGGRLYWLYHENGAMKREDGQVVLRGKLDPRMRYRLARGRTVVGKSGRIAVIDENGGKEVFSTDNFGLLPVFDTAGNDIFWLRGGSIWQYDSSGPRYIGDILERQTLLWSGPEFGFGFYRAGRLAVYFTFTGGRRGVNDSIKLPRLTGHLLDAVCLFSGSRAYFLSSWRDNGVETNRCFLIKKDGAVEASAETAAGDGSWLGRIRGRCAAGNFLLAATDDGIVRIEAQNGRLDVVKEFPDTRPYVNENTRLFPGKDGLFAVGSRDIIRLTINP